MESSSEIPARLFVITNMSFARAKAQISQTAEITLAIASMEDKARLDLNSMIEFDKTFYYDWNVIRSLMYGFRAIYWVFLSTQRYSPLGLSKHHTTR